MKFQTWWPGRAICH